MIRKWFSYYFEEGDMIRLLLKGRTMKYRVIIEKMAAGEFLSGHPARKQGRRQMYREDIFGWNGGIWGKVRFIISEDD